MSDNRSRKQTSLRTRASAETVFGTMASAGAKEYVRSRDLPGLISLWPAEIADVSTEGSLLILGKLRRALRAERRRGSAGHWSYDLNRHLGLWSAYKAELATDGNAGASQTHCARCAWARERARMTG